MKRISLYALGVAAVLALIGHNVTTAETKAAAPAASEAAKAGAPNPAEAAKAEMMKKWEAASTPGVEHKRLDALAGTWKHTVTWWMEPNGQPEVSEGTTEAQWVLDGRFLQQKATGTAMGQPFEGIGYTGYDNIRKEYSSVWMDSMSTTMMSSTSQYDPATNSVNETGSFACPMTGESHRAFKGKISLGDGKSYKYEMWSKHTDGTEFKNMEIVYTKQ
jgi:hypothetical protein